MADLNQYLGALERDGAQELMLQSGTSIAVRVENQLEPLSDLPLETGEIQELLSGTPLAGLLPGGDTAGEKHDVSVGERRYAVTVARYANRIQMRIAKASASAPAPARAATPMPDAVLTGSRPEHVRAPPKRATHRELPRHVGGPAPAAPGPAPAARPAPAPAPAPPARQARPEPRPAPRPAPAPAHHPTPAPAAAPAAGPPRRRASAPPRQVRADPQLVALLTEARGIGASDVHLLSGRPAMVRRAGELQPKGTELEDGLVRRLLGSVIDDSLHPALEERGYIDFAVELPGPGRLRVNVCRQRTGVKGCFRLIAPEPPTLEAIGLPEELKKLTQYHQGLAVISGPSGHGKTTTMSALVDLLNASKPIHIITVEDPIEIIHPIKAAVMSQREVGAHTESFARALKGALRQDPDVIAIGELRDRETVEMALSAAETGHLVLATMSTPSGAKTIDRLIDMFPPDDQSQVRATLAGALKLVIGQRLVPGVDGRSMFAASELITGTVPLWAMIRDNKLFQLPSLQQRGRAYGMVRIEDSLSELARAGKISEETARLYADDPRALKLSAAPPPQPEEPEKRGTFSGLLRRKR